MNAPIFRLKDTAALMAAVSAAFPAAAQTTGQAARIDFATTGVSAVGTDGRPRDLGKGALIFQGDTIRTGDAGRAQLRFTDGAQIALSPGSEFRIEEYAFAGKPDGSERGIFNLIRGGLRTITGLVGSQNRQNYALRTSVATIGIRGTAFSVQYTNSIVVTPTDGTIEACNSGGCATAGAGQSLFVPNVNTQPTVVAARTAVPPAPLPQPPMGFAKSEDTNASGGPAAVPPSAPQPLLPVNASGSVNLAFVHDTAYVTGGECCFFNVRESGSPVALIPGTAGFNSAGAMTSFFDPFGVPYGGSAGLVSFPGTVVTQDFASPTQTVPVFGNDTIIAWGRWSGATTSPGTALRSGLILTAPESLHYIAGVPTPTADISALAQAGVTNAHYVLIGATNPTQMYNLGRFNSATMGVNFVTGRVNTTFNLTISSQTFNAQVNNISMIGSGFSTSIGAPSVNVSSSGGACACGCTASVEGFFAGNGAIRAGYAYQIRNTSDTNGFNPHAVGVAAFRKQ